jgi:hypothetical protein
VRHAHVDEDRVEDGAAEKVQTFTCARRQDDPADRPLLPQQERQLVSRWSFVVNDQNVQVLLAHDARTPGRYLGTRTRTVVPAPGRDWMDSPKAVPKA